MDPILSEPSLAQSTTGHAEQHTEKLETYAGVHHARLIDERVPFHIISRVFQGRHLLRPDVECNEIIIGVLGRAQALFPRVELFAIAFLSNHFHAIVRGCSQDLPFFVGYIKREISRRIGGRPDVDWSGGMWQQYVATALPTAESQVRCMKYVLAQSVKEHLVERPEDWPGVHCVRTLMLGQAMVGRWLDATGFSRARLLEERKANPAPVHRADFVHTYHIVFAPLPPWTAIDEAGRQALVAAMVREVCEEAEAERFANGRQVVGRDAVLQVPRDRRTALPKPPWHQKRRRMICWAHPGEPEARSYLRDYWNFQRAFSDASRRFREGVLDTSFPPRAFRPVSHQAPPRARTASVGP